MDSKAPPEKVRSLLAHTSQLFAARPFTPHPLFKNSHAQTLGAFAWPRKYRFQTPTDEEQIFDVAVDVKVPRSLPVAAGPERTPYDDRLARY